MREKYCNSYACIAQRACVRRVMVFCGAFKGSLPRARTAISATPHFVIPAAFSPRERGEGIQRLCHERHWVPAWPCLETSPFGLVFAGTTTFGRSFLRAYVAIPRSPTLRHFHGPHSSFPRRRESSVSWAVAKWIPASAGMTNHYRPLAGFDSAAASRHIAEVVKNPGSGA